MQPRPLSPPPQSHYTFFFSFLTPLISLIPTLKPKNNNIAEENNGFRASTQREVAPVARILEPYNGIQPLQLQLLLEPVDEIVGLGVHLIITLHHPNLSERRSKVGNSEFVRPQRIEPIRQGCC
jgi:hypothetical protein